MFRRCVSVLLLLGYVAGELATVPHAHGGLSVEQQTQHDARPHIHLGPFAHRHEHGHPPAGHSHRHLSDHEPAGEADQSPAESHPSGSEHDRAAIFFPSGTAAHSPGRNQTTATSTKQSSALAVGLAAAGFDGRVRPSCVAIHAPDVGPPHAKRFLTLRNLRL